MAILSFSVFIFIFYYYNYQEIVYPWKLIFVSFVHCKELKLKGFSFSFSQTRDWFAIHSSHWFQISCKKLLSFPR